MFDIATYKLSDHDGTSLAAWQAANRYTYGRYLNTLAVVIMAAVIPFEMAIFDFDLKYLKMQLSLVGASLLMLGCMSVVERTRDYASSRVLIQGIYGAALAFPLLSVNVAHLWYLMTSPPKDLGILLAGTLMVTIFTTFFGYRFRQEQLATNVICAAAAVALSTVSAHASRELVLVAIVHMNAGIAAAYSRRLFAKFVGLQRELESKIQNQHDIIAAQSAELSKADVYRSIADTTQMLAHDVRKPFSILVMGMRSLGHIKDPAQFGALANKLIPEVHLALSRVNAMIEDIMEIGAPLDRGEAVPVSIELLIETSLRESFQTVTALDIYLSYQLAFQGGVLARPKKLERVFTNIITNAVQAMGPSGKLWFRTREVAVGERGFVEVTIGNSNTFIGSADLAKLFDAFFTRGKKNGTGLGLAICQKIVEAHGGTIRCQSEKNALYPEGQVEFVFTLPKATDGGTYSPLQLPRHSKELSLALPGASGLTGTDETGSDTSADRGERQLEMKIQEACSKLGRALSVVIVDDESIYRNALSSYLARDGLDALVLTHEFGGSSDCMDYVKDHHADLIVTDVDMGSESLSGFDLVVELRNAAKSACSRSLICVHSNRIVAQDHRMAVERGADIFVPKPMARGQLLRLLLQSAEKALHVAAMKALVATTTSAPLVGYPKARPEIAFIDDNVFIGEAWLADLAADARLHYFESAEKFFAAVQADSGFLARLLCVVTDYFFDGSPVNGIDVARFVKSKSVATVVFLSSDADFETGELAGAVDAVISKSPVPVAQLADMVSKRRRLPSAG